MPSSTVTSSLPAQLGQRLSGATSRFRPVLMLLTALFVFLSVTQPAFLTRQNVTNILTASSVLWIVAIGMTFVVLSGGFDLSSGALAATAGIFLAKALDAHIPGSLAVIATIAAGAIAGGLLNGMLIGKLGLSVFVVTLATMTAFTGIVNLWSNTQSFFVTAPIVGDLTVHKYAGLQAPIWLMLGLAIIALYVQSRTYFGRDVYACGGNVTAARLSGISVARTTIAVYAIAGACAALGGIVAVGRTGAATPQVDTSLALQAIAAVLLGGTSLAGGAGGVGGTVLGVLFIGTLQNGLSIAGVQSFWQQILTGIVLIAAVLGDRIGLSQMRAAWRRRAPTASGSVPNVPAEVGPVTAAATTEDENDADRRYARDAN